MSRTITMNVLPLISDEEHAEVVAEQDAQEQRIPGLGGLRMTGKGPDDPEWDKLVDALVAHEYIDYKNSGQCKRATWLKGIRCPAHGGKSFFMRRDKVDGRFKAGEIRWACNGGCSGKDILAALGIEQADPGGAFGTAGAAREQPSSTQSQPQVPQVPQTEEWGGFGFISGTDLAALDIPPVEWLVPGLIPASGITLLAGPPKSCKTWLGIGVAASVAALAARVVADENPFSPANAALVALAAGGGPLSVNRQGTVLYFTPDDPNLGRFRNRCEAIMGDTGVPPDLHVTDAQEPGTGATFADRLIAELECRKSATSATNPPVRLVVIDTLQRVKAPGKGADRYADDVAALKHLRRVCVAHPDVAILVLHHSRKVDPKHDSDPLELISGSQGVAGGVDQTLILQVPSDRGPARTLHVIGRDGVDRKLALTMTERGLALVDEDPDDPARLLSDASARVLRVLRESFTPDGLSIDEVAARAAMPNSTARDRLRRLVEQGHAIRVERGHYRAAEWTGDTR